MVNVPIPVANVVTSFPRAFSEAEVVQIHLKRRMEYSLDFMTETIGPSKVADAIRFLADTELYRKHQVTVDEQWLSSFASAEDRDLVAQLVKRSAEASTNEQNGSELENIKGQETLLENVPIINIAMQRIGLAPGEG